MRSSLRRNKPKKTKKPKREPSWSQLAQADLAKIFAQVNRITELKRKAGGSKHPLHAGVEFVSAPQMKRLNKSYLKKDYATDILSFSAPEVFRTLGYLGELVLCLPVLKQQARQYGHSEQVELKVLLTHGVLHLLGMDHEIGPKEREVMRAYEAKILKKLGGGAGLILRAHSGKKVQ